MNKSEFCALVADAVSMSRTGVGDAVSATFSAIADALAAGESVAIAQFGAFRSRERPARIGRNPRAGEAISIAAWRQAKGCS